MKASFPKAMKWVLADEGGFVNDKHDPGGATNKGITLNTLMVYCRRPHPVRKPFGTFCGSKWSMLRWLRKISDETAADVYRRFYWNAINGDNLPWGLDYAVFDFAVNSGPRRAARVLQQMLGVTADGIIGPYTLKKINQRVELNTPYKELGVSLQALIDEYIDTRLRFLKELHTWKYYGRGWLNRINRVRRRVKLLTTPRTEL